MKTLKFTMLSQPVANDFKSVICGVVGSGNLEVLVAEFDTHTQCNFTVNTSVIGFDHVWEAVLQEFANRHAVGGLSFQMNDMGATPAVVTLRLSQAITLLKEEAHG